MERIRKIEITSTYVHNAALGDTAQAEAISSEEDKIEDYCCDRYNKKININDRVYLLTKGKYKVCVGRILQIDCQSKWITIESDTGQNIIRKSYNTKVL